MNINDLIGKKFRRNKYGLSVWEDSIIEIGWHQHLVSPISKLEEGNYFQNLKESKIQYGWYPEVFVKGTSGHCYSFKEIVIYG